MVTAAVPSGASTGKYEAAELRDGDKSDHFGKSKILFNLCVKIVIISILDVNKAINNFNNIIAPALKNCSLLISEQNKIDELLLRLDGSENKSNLGANSILASSMLFVKASAIEKVIGAHKAQSRHIFRIFQFTSVSMKFLPYPVHLSPFLFSMS